MNSCELPIEALGGLGDAKGDPVGVVLGDILGDANGEAADLGNALPLKLKLLSFLCCPLSMETKLRLVTSCSPNLRSLRSAYEDLGTPSLSLVAFKMVMCGVNLASHS